MKTWEHELLLSVVSTVNRPKKSVIYFLSSCHPVFFRFTIHTESVYSNSKIYLTLKQPSSNLQARRLTHTVSVYLEVYCATENLGGGALHEYVVVVLVGDDEVASRERYCDWFAFGHSTKMGECYYYGACPCATGKGFARTSFPHSHTQMCRW